MEQMCGWCSFRDDLAGIVNHISDEHPCEDLKYRRKVLSALTGSMVWQSYVVPIKPNVLEMEGKFIEIDNDSGVINIVCETYMTPGNSPAHKQLKRGSSEEKVLRKSLFPEGVDDDEQYAYPVPSIEDKLMALFSSVIQELKSNDQMKNWEMLLTLVGKGGFPFHNIAYQLFMDVVQFLSLDNTCAMRYSDTVKRFWATGYRLFHGKFLRFLSGVKNRFVQTNTISHFMISLYMDIIPLECSMHTLAV